MQVNSIVNEYAVRSLCEINGKDILYAVSISKRANDALMELFGIPNTDTSWVEGDKISCQTCFSEYKALMLFGFNSDNKASEDEIGKMLEICCAGAYKDIKARYGDISVNMLHFSGIAAEAVRETFEELRGNK